MYFKAHSYVLSYFCCIITLGRRLILRSLFYSWRYNHSGRSLKVWVLVRNVWLCHSGFKSRSFFTALCCLAFSWWLVMESIFSCTFHSIIVSIDNRYTFVYHFTLHQAISYKSFHLNIRFLIHKKKKVNCFL